MCYIVPTKKRQDQIKSKYNKIYPISLSDIPESEKELALSEFSEGLEELRLCLKVLWDNKLETKACCAGNHNDESHAYIAMAESGAISGIILYFKSSFDLSSARLSIAP